MKSVSLISLLLVAGVVVGAGLCFMVTDWTSRTARRELAAFEEEAAERASNARIITRDSSGTYSVPLLAQPAISGEDRLHIETLDLKYQSLAYRRGLASLFFTRGIFAAVGIGILSWLQKKIPPNQSLQPTAPSGHG